MTTLPPIIDEAERIVRRLAARLAEVRPGECLCCYMWRQLELSGCDGTQRHALSFRDAVAPRATALRERLGRIGGWCDCQVFLNGYEPQLHLWTPPYEVEHDGATHLVDAEPPDPVPACARVRRGSVRPCANWARIRRPW